MWSLFLESYASKYKLPHKPLPKLFNPWGLMKLDACLVTFAKQPKSELKHLKCPYNCSKCVCYCRTLPLLELHESSCTGIVTRGTKPYTWIFSPSTFFTSRVATFNKPIYKFQIRNLRTKIYDPANFQRNRQWKGSAMLTPSLNIIDCTLSSRAKVKLNNAAITLFNTLHEVIICARERLVSSGLCFWFNLHTLYNCCPVYVNGLVWVIFIIYIIVALCLLDEQTEPCFSLAFI